MGKFWQISTELWPLIDVRNIENILWRGMLHACSAFIKVIKLYEFFKISIYHILKKLTAIFVTIATVKVKLIPNVYTWSIVLIN